MPSKKKPTVRPKWTRSQVESALAAAGGSPTRAAEGCGLTHQRFYALMKAHGVTAPRSNANPGNTPSNAGRGNPAVGVTLPQRLHDWIAAQDEGRSQLVQRGLDYLSAPDRAAWLAANETTDVLTRALAARKAAEE